MSASLSSSSTPLGPAPRVIVASAFGRGHWLSVALHRRGFNVQLVDVTHQLGGSLTEDREGPFGYFESRQWPSSPLSPSLSAASGSSSLLSSSTSSPFSSPSTSSTLSPSLSPAEALQSLGSCQELTMGLPLWLSSGPWELRGASFAYRAKALKQSDVALNFIQQCGDNNSERRTGIDKLQSLDFEKRWIASLACDLLSNRSQWPNEAFQKSPPAALFEKYYARIPEERNLQSSLQWCADQGVTVIENAEIPDLAIENRSVQGLEINAEKSGFVRCHHLIWCMTSMETAHFSQRAFLKLYKGKTMEPEWCWLRYKIEFENSLDLLQLPQEFLFIDEINLPWAHDNYAFFKRSQQARHFHVWLRLPYSQRFHREYLNDRIQPLVENLKRRNPRLKAKNVVLPLEATSSLKELGAPLFPLYRAMDLAHPPGISLKNLWFSHPEYWPSYSWASIFNSQNQMISELRRWWGALSEEQKQKELQL